MYLKITGHSMEPTLREGDRVWASSFLRKPSKGDIVVLRHPHHHETLLVKRIAKNLGYERYEVKGDNPNDSLDSRVFGPVSQNDIIGKIHFRYWPLKEIRWFA